jgi:hypothetical protein
MTAHFFQNRWYRIYFQLSDAFRKQRCSICYLLAQKEQAIIITWLEAYNPRKRRGNPLKALCALHRSRIKEALSNDPAFLPMLKIVLGASLRELARPPKAPAPPWKRSLQGFFIGCPICGPLLREEKNLFRALIEFLEDVEFWKGFQRSPLFCLDHLEKCLATPGKGKGFERLLNDQNAKLNDLLNELVRFEATGTHEESKLTALNWFADFAGTPPGAGGMVVSTGDNISNELLPEPPTHRPALDGHDPEELLFENEKLRRKVRELIDSLSKVETRAASLHYRCVELSETNKRLEMGYTGASTQARGLAILVQDLRAEIKRLEEGTTASRAKAVS